MTKNKSHFSRQILGGKEFKVTLQVFIYLAMLKTRLKVNFYLLILQFNFNQILNTTKERLKK